MKGPNPPRRPGGQLLAEDLRVVADVHGKTRMEKEVLNRRREGIGPAQLADLGQQLASLGRGAGKTSRAGLQHDRVMPWPSGFLPKRARVSMWDLRRGSEMAVVMAPRV